MDLLKFGRDVINFKIIFFLIASCFNLICSEFNESEEVIVQTRVSKFLQNKTELIKDFRKKLIYKELKTFLKNQNLKSNYLISQLRKDIIKILFLLKTDQFNEAMLVLENVKNDYKLNFPEFDKLQICLNRFNNLKINNFQEIKNVKFNDYYRLGSIEWSKDDKEIVCTIGKYLSYLDSSDLSVQYNYIVDPFDSYCMDITPDETKVRLLPKDGHPDLLIYDLIEKKIVSDFETLSPIGSSCVSPIVTTAWSPCSSKIAVSFPRGEIIIYDFKTRKRLNVFKFNYCIYKMSWCKSGDKLLVNECNKNNPVYLLDIESGEYELLYEHITKEGNTGPRINEFIWITDTKFAASSNYSIVFYDLETKEIYKTYYLNNPQLDIKQKLTFLSPDGKLLAMIKVIKIENLYYYLVKKMEIEIWDIENNDLLINELDIQDMLLNAVYYSNIVDLKWSNDCKSLAAATDNGQIKIWQAKNIEEIIF